MYDFDVSCTTKLGYEVTQKRKQDESSDPRYWS